MKVKATYTKFDGTRNTVEVHDYTIKDKVRRVRESHPHHDMNVVIEPLDWTHERLTPELRDLLSDTGKYVLQSEAFQTDRTLVSGGYVYLKTYEDNNGRKFTFETKEKARRFHDLFSENGGSGTYKISELAHENQR